MSLKRWLKFCGWLSDPVEGEECRQPATETVIEIYGPACETCSKALHNSDYPLDQLGQVYAVPIKELKKFIKKHGRRLRGPE